MIKYVKLYCTASEVVHVGSFSWNGEPSFVQFAVLHIEELPLQALFRSNVFIVARQLLFLQMLHVARITQTSWLLQSAMIVAAVIAVIV